MQEYLNAARWYQEQQLGMPVEAVLRRAAKRLSRAATKELMSGKLKECFDLNARPDITPFNALIIAIWFTMRESELANARVGDLRLEDANVAILLYRSKRWHSLTLRLWVAVAATVPHARQWTPSGQGDAWGGHS